MSNISLPPNLALQSPSEVSGKVASTQVTSTEILQNAFKPKIAKTEQDIQDLEELRLLQLTKRREFEQHINKNRLNLGQWTRYAQWELEHNHDFRRFRLIMERALEVNTQHIPFWVRYIESELMYKNVNHARNLLNRAVTILPKVDKLWFLYVHTEEALGNYSEVRDVFERWLKWRPGPAVWDSYIAFEQKYDEHENVRKLYMRYVRRFSGAETWLKWAIAEMAVPGTDTHKMGLIRGVFEAALDHTARKFTDDAVRLVRECSNWELSVGEPERATAVVLTILDKVELSDGQRLQLLEIYSELDRSQNTRGPASSEKEKLLLLNKVNQNPRDYDSWWELAKINLRDRGVSDACSALERAGSFPPLDDYKSVKWRRYVFLWIRLALTEEFVANDAEAARSKWKQALKMIPHDKFTFAKIWSQFAHFELRHSGLPKARKIMGQAIGATSKNPKAKIFKTYIELEKSLGEWDRCRMIYERWIEAALLLGNIDSIIESVEQYVGFDEKFGDLSRVVLIYETSISLARSIEGLDILPLVSKYTEFAREEFRYDTIRDFFLELIALDESPRWWIESAHFESSILSPEQLDELENLEGNEFHFELGEFQKRATRLVFKRALAQFRSNDPQAALEILDAWKEYETKHGALDDVTGVEAKYPKKITKTRMVDGIDEIYYEYEFPVEKPDLSRFLLNAKKWKAPETTIQEQE